MKLYLASVSPRRRELLATLGIPFEVIPPRFEEAPTDKTAGEEALYFADGKARSVAADCPASLILASDTLIECDGEKIGKPTGGSPKDESDARKILQKLSGKTHRVFTAVVLLDTSSGVIKKHLEAAIVTFRPLSPQQIEDYIRTGEPFGKAGGYAIQGKGRSLIAAVEGDEEAVIGLPLKPVREWLTSVLKSGF